MNMFIYYFFKCLTNRTDERNGSVIFNISFVIFLKTGLTFDCFYISGTFAVVNDVLNMSVRIGETESAISLSIRLLIISGPQAFPTCMVFKIL